MPENTMHPQRLSLSPFFPTTPSGKTAWFIRFKINVWRKAPFPMMTAQKRFSSTPKEPKEKEGKTEARQEDIKILIETYQEFSISKEDALSKLASKYHLSAKEAQNYIETYWT